MLDQFGRNITYLRLSVTERCQLRCTYCRVEEGICPKAKELSPAEYEGIVRACMQLGIQKVRLTGGEPLLRKDILELVERIAALEGLRDLSMTTNAQMLPGKSQLLKQAGLRRLNISLDSLKPEVFHELTGGDIQPVLQGMEEAAEAGLLPLKLNIVLVRGINEGEIDDFIALTRENPIDVRFIELMPIGDHGENTARRISNQEVLNARPYLQPLPARYPGQPSVDYQVPGYRGRVGFISPISHQFCADCNRIRVMSDGTLRPCLGVDREIPLTSALAKDDEALREAIQSAIFKKPAAHRFESCAFAERNMSRIGG